MKRKTPIEQGVSRKQFPTCNKMDPSWTLYDRCFPYFREPKEIGAFSINSMREFQDDKSQLKVFIPPPDFENCSFDLKKGYNKMIKKDENLKSYINDLLRWTMLHKEKFLLPNNTNYVNDVPLQHIESLNTDFICWRGLLTRILCLPYENREDFKIAVIRTRGTYFMCQFDTEVKKKREEEMTERDKEMCAWGWKFEQYVTAADAHMTSDVDEMHGTPDTDRPVNNNEEYGVVVRSRLGSHSLVYGAEVDCTDPDDPKCERYLELKTSRIVQTRRQYENFCRFKLIKFWAQSYLIGIRKIICGFRDDGGTVRKLKDYHVKDIPKLASSVIRNGWNPAVCFNFLDSFLNFVKANIPNDDESCAYVFYWKPGSQLVCEGPGDKSFYFLPDWFLNWEQWDKPVETT